MFDASWYLENNHDVRDAKIDPLEHFLTIGWKEGRNPSLAFDTKFYLQSYPDVVEAGINPLVHFIETGCSEGRQPLPEVDLSAFQVDEKILQEFFDENYYRTHYPNVVQPNDDAFIHFMTVGWRSGCNPSTKFDTQFYLDNNPDVSFSSLNPLEHYVKSGHAEGRLGIPLHVDEAGLQNKALARNMKIVAADFDPKFYRHSNPDLTGNNNELFYHFMTLGWKEGRNPSQKFDVKYYLWANPDVSAANINPLLHYRLHAQTEIRRNRQPHAIERAILKNCRSVQDREPFWQLPMSEKSVDKVYLISFLKLNREEQGYNAGLIVSISHNDYCTAPGDINSCIRDEALAFSSHGWAYLHLFPTCTISTLAPFQQGEFVASLNGQYIGRVTVNTLLAFLETQKIYYPNRYLIIHHLMGAVTECVPIIARKMNAQKNILWLHDFFTICPSYALMRNDIAFCDAPVRTSAACKICAYGVERQRHLPRIKTLFEELLPEVIAPSQHMLSFWEKKTSLSVVKASVQEHAFITDKTFVKKQLSCTLKIGFVGTPVFYKGWEIYRKLATQFLGDARYEFFYFGFSPQEAVNITSVSVNIAQNDRDSMQKCIRRHEIDIVVNWPLSPEEFSFTAYEAVAAGTFLLVPKESKIFEDFLTSVAEKIGYAARDVEELISLFATGELRSLVEKSARMVGKLVIRPGTFPYLTSEKSQ
ncbi:hypothetical protein [Gluconobacter sp. GP1]|uniref:hypothetical protein n=1 Tax=Gluconobacter sp. GP1 TaxID=3046423 RepID=UPI00293E5091|nr:hypothetical protein [Gluconobacter sp. GP1]